MNWHGLPMRDPCARLPGHWILLALLATCAGGCDFPGQPKPEDEYVPPQKELSFDALFKQNCVACHGKDGKLGPGPPLNDKLFLALAPDAELERVITEGRAGTPMAAFAHSKGGALTAEQVTILARGIKPRWGSGELAPSGAPPYLPPQPKPEGNGIIEAGKKVFARACASCHGDHGQGGRYAGKADGKEVGAINNHDNPVFLNLISDQALRRYVITGRPDLRMPDYADPQGRPEGFKPLTAQDVTNVTALLANWRQGGSVNGKGN
jgi:cytochrome c oxidase cbb3-type subunit III